MRIDTAKGEFPFRNSQHLDIGERSQQGVTQCTVDQVPTWILQYLLVFSKFWALPTARTSWICCRSWYSVIYEQHLRDFFSSTKKRENPLKVFVVIFRRVRLAGLEKEDTFLLHSQAGPRKAKSKFSSRHPCEVRADNEIEVSRKSDGQSWSDQNRSFIDRKVKLDVVRMVCFHGCSRSDKKP